jgi:replicative superfamily II helicase
MGKYRFIFEIEKTGNMELLFVILAERSDNLLELRANLLSIKNKFIQQFYAQLIDFNGNITDFFDFESTVEEIMEKDKKIIDDLTFHKIEQIFKDLQKFSSFVIEAALLTQNGSIIKSSLHKNILSEIIRMLEARHITGKDEINELITLEDFGILSLNAVNKQMISVIQFKRECPFETALIISKKISKKIKNTL